MDSIICRPVMLPQVGEPVLPSIVVGTPELGLRITESKFGMKEAIYYHLYLVSDRNIRKGDYFLNGMNNLSLATKDTFIGDWYNVTSKSCRKIEATTDKSLNLPLIPHSFVEKYIQAQRKIDRVSISIYYDRANITDAALDYPGGEVIIIPVKDSWNREELKTELNKAYQLGHAHANKVIGYEEFNEWFNKTY